MLVHGLGVSATYLAPTAERLAGDFRVLVPELPGFGHSDRPPQALNIPQMADVLAAWLREVGLGEVGLGNVGQRDVGPSDVDRSGAAFLGNSMGCQVIIDLAVRYPQLVQRAILVGPTVDTVGRTLRRQLWRGARDLLHEPWSLLPILAHDYLAAGTRPIYRTCRLALADPVERKLPLVRAPVLLVRGSRDTLATQRWLEQMQQLLPIGKLVVIPGATHAANYSAPDDLARLTREFLRQT